MGYAGDRVTAWLHPEQDPGDTGYQILQSLYAIGSGGLFGLGLGKSRQKYLYLPFQYNDYIFAICCEELGLLGASFLIALFAMLFFVVTNQDWAFRPQQLIPAAAFALAYLLLGHVFFLVPLTGPAAALLAGLIALGGAMIWAVSCMARER